MRKAKFSRVKLNSRARVKTDGRNQSKSQAHRRHALILDCVRDWYVDYCYRSGKSFVYWTFCSYFPEPFLLFRSQIALKLYFPLYSMDESVDLRCAIRAILSVDPILS